MGKWLKYVLLLALSVVPATAAAQQAATLTGRVTSTS